MNDAALAEAADRAVFHDHTDTGTCPDCADEDGMCVVAGDLWHAVYVAAKARRLALGIPLVEGAAEHRP